MPEEVVWAGRVDDRDVRIVQLDKDDCLVEYEDGGKWRSADDELASHTYLAAFLDVRQTVADAVRRLRDDLILVGT